MNQSDDESLPPAFSSTNNNLSNETCSSIPTTPTATEENESSSECILQSFTTIDKFQHAKSTAVIHCPVCNKTFSKAIIEEHVDSCLQKSNPFMIEVSDEDLLQFDVDHCQTGEVEYLDVTSPTEKV